MFKFCLNSLHNIFNYYKLNHCEVGILRWSDDEGIRESLTLHSSGSWHRTFKLISIIPFLYLSLYFLSNNKINSRSCCFLLKIMLSSHLTYHIFIIKISSGIVANLEMQDISCTQYFSFSIKPPQPSALPPHFPVESTLHCQEKTLSF